MAVKVSESDLQYAHPLYQVMNAPGLSVAVGSLDQILTWGLTNSLWIFPMATSCCGIELMAAAAARVDLDRMGTILRGSPRQSDVMVVAGTITVKMAPRVRKLWDQMPEPKWCIAMGSCAISGDFYRKMYSVVPGVDTLLPVDVYIPGCPPNPEALMQGLLELKERIAKKKLGEKTDAPARPAPFPGRLRDPERDPAVTQAQTDEARSPGDTAGAFKAQPLPSCPRASPQSETADFAALLAKDFGITDAGKDGPPKIDAKDLLAVAQAAKGAGYTLLSFIVASHWPAAAPKPAAEGEAPVAQPDELELAYGMRRPGPGAPMASWRIRVPIDTEVDSLSALFAGANWQEREQYDLLGVKFKNHPDLRRLLLPEAWQGHPLRRDYASDTPHPPWR